MGWKAMSGLSAESKSSRILSMYARLSSGGILVKRELAEEYNVAEKSIQRDLDALRDFIIDKQLGQDLIYDHKAKGYRLVNQIPKGLTNSEILAVCKILLESRSMITNEMFPIIEKLIDCAVPIESRQMVKSLIANEMYHYIAPHHNKQVLNNLWGIGQAIKHQQVTEIEYERVNNAAIVNRRIHPVGLIFSEYYFYITAFQERENKETFDNPDDIYPTIYRVDRIKSIKIMKEHFPVPYRDRFEEGEFRKRVQFMYGGRLQHITFKYIGPSIEAVLDRLPTAKIKDGDQEQGYIVEAEVFGKGYEMWVRSQGDYITNLEVKEHEYIRRYQGRKS